MQVSQTDSCANLPLNIAFLALKYAQQVEQDMQATAEFFLHQMWLPGPHV